MVISLGFIKKILRSNTFPMEKWSINLQNVSRNLTPIWHPLFRHGILILTMTFASKY